MRPKALWSEGWLARGLLAVCMLLLVGCTSEIYHGLEESSANEMVVVLEQNGIDGIKEPDPTAEGRWMIKVPAASEVEAWRVLKSRGLPRPEVGGFDSLFPGGGLVPTEKEERMKFQYATAQELRRGLLTLDGVVDAQINLVVPEKPRVPMPNQPKAKPRASVLVMYRPEGKSKKAPITPDEVRKLVAGGVEEMTPENVNVILKSETSSRAEIQDPDYVQYGFLSISPGSKKYLTLTIIFVMLLFCGATGGLFFLYWRARSAGATPQGGGGGGNQGPAQ